MSQHLPALIIIVPLLASLVIAALGWVNKKFCFPLAIISLGMSLYFSVGLLCMVLEKGMIKYRLGGWPPPWGIAYNVDHLNGLVLVVVNLVAFLNLIANKRLVEDEFPEKIAPFYTLYVLFVVGLSGMVVTGDAFNLYVLLEIASLTGYALIGIGRDHAPLSALKYLLMGTIGATLYLLGVGYLYMMTGTLNMADLASLLPEMYESKVVMFAFVLCLTGLFVKMAFFPLHAWLPNAYSSAPSSVASLIAPLTTKVMIYVMIRVALTIFTPQYSFVELNISGVIVWLAVIAIVAGSLFALSQRSLKKTLSYIVIAEVGYMVGGFWLGNHSGMTGAILHIVNDAMMTLCVFLAAGSILYKTGGDSFDDLKGLFRKMPFSMAAFVTGALAIIGVPPTCGFFSKWYLISGGIEAGHYGFVVALLFSSLANVIIFFRLFEICYYEPFADHHPHEAESPSFNEAPAGMLVPLLVVAVLLIVLGVYTGDIVTNIIQFALPAQVI